MDPKGVDSPAQSFLQEYIIEDKEGLKTAIQKCTEFVSNFEELNLNKHEKEFFKKDYLEYKKKIEKYEYLAHLTTILRTLHAAIEAILTFEQEKIQNEVKGMIELVQRAFRRLYREKDTVLSVLMLRFIEVANWIKNKDLKNSQDFTTLFFLILIIVSQILKEFISVLENSLEKEIEMYNEWIKLAVKQLTKIKKDPIFQALLVSVSSGTVAAIGPSLGLVALGFTASGVQAGSIAAAWMSTIGNVSSGSLFATLQSVGAVGLSGLATGGLAIGGALIGLSIFGLAKYMSKPFLIEVKLYIQETTRLRGPFSVECCSKMKVEYFILERLVETMGGEIDKNTSRLGVQIYREKVKTLIPISMKELREKIVSIGDALDGYSMIIFDKDKGNYDHETLPFYLQRERAYRGCWKIKSQ